MVAKLKVDLSAGVLEVEGPEDFVREIHEAFRSYAPQQARPLTKPEPLLRQEAASDGTNGAADSEPQAAPKRRKGSSRRAKTATAEGAVRPTQYAPTVIRDLDLKGLKEFIAPYTLNGHADKILAFGMYLRDQMGIHPFSADHLYTAYRFVGERTPGAFLQAIRDASKKKDLVDYQSPTHISITHIGENRFLHDLPQAGTET
ncbi:MAG TPA: hypothetical protein VF552_11850 [Allosphingosinicella sp.]|jgi:hypothetical protein